jgi:hypothetical protein
MFILSIPVKLAEKYLSSKQFVRVVDTRSGQAIGWCNVEDLKELLFNKNVDLFHLVPLDSEGEPMHHLPPLQCNNSSEN